MPSTKQLEPLTKEERQRHRELEDQIEDLRAQLVPILKEWEPLEARYEAFCAQCGKLYAGFPKCFVPELNEVVCRLCFAAWLEAQNCC